MHSLPGRLRSLVYLRSSGPRRRGDLWLPAEKWKGRADSTPSFPSREENKGGSLYTIQRLSRHSSRAVHTLLARFTRHILRPLRSRLRSYVFTFTIVTKAPRGLLLRDNSRHSPPLTPRSEDFTRGKDRILLLFSSLFHANLSSLSLNPRYPRADHLGNLSFCVDDISDPDGACEPNDLSHDVEYLDISRGEDRSLLRVSNRPFSVVSQNPWIPSILIYV